MAECRTCGLRNVVLHPVKILVIRFSSIGDIVLTTPVMRCLHMQIPGVEIHFATKKKFAGLLANNPHIHRIHGLDDDFASFAHQLRSEKFDHVIDLHSNLRTLRLRAALRGVNWHSFDKANLHKWLLVRRWTKKPVEHVVYRYMKAASALNVTYDGQGLDFFTSDERKPADLPESYVAYAIGGTWNTKRMPLEKMKEIIAGANKPWVLLGDQRDAQEGALLEAAFPDRVHNLCGKMSLEESALALRYARSVVTHDTGLMHIAAAYNIPVISIWGNTVPEFGMTPFFPENRMADNDLICSVQGLGCRPCSKIGFEKCPKGHFQCMNRQDTTAICIQLSKN